MWVLLCVNQVFYQPGALNRYSDSVQYTFFVLQATYFVLLL